MSQHNAFSRHKEGQEQKMKFIPLLLAIWKAWDLQIFVLTSLILQVILIFVASFRKRNTTIWFRAILWLAYLLADPVAIVALGILAHSDKCVDHSHNKDLLAFWAPFLLLHLGGPDTITALAVEDNELWLRHLLNLVFQVGMASYVFVGTLPKTRLLVPAIFMFLAGILKYVERTVALWSASMDRMRNSMITKQTYPDTMPRFHQEDTQIENLEEETLILKAYELMQAFMPLVADLTISFQERFKSRDFFHRRSPMQAFKVVDAELAFLYERLYTKSAVIETIAGCVLRLITLSSILTSLILFILTKKDGYLGVDTAITYILLAGALALECYSVGLLIFSDWAFIQLKAIHQHSLSKLIFTIISFFQPPSKPRLRNSMSQCNLISFCLKDRKPTLFKGALEHVGWKEAWDNKFQHRGRDIVSDEMKEFLFDYIKSKSPSTVDFSEQHFSAYRGQKALENSGLSDRIKRSIEVGFHHSIITWHIATDICYHTDPNENINARMISKQLSDYMLHLLIMKPFMLTAGTGQLIYGHARDELKHLFLRRGVDNVSEHEARRRLSDGSLLDLIIRTARQSFVYDGCLLAKDLQRLESRKWDVISGVWVEMLCFAAARCRGMYHAKELSDGAEFLTFIWLIMHHMSPTEIDEQFRVLAVSEIDRQLYETLRALRRLR